MRKLTWKPPNFRCRLRRKDTGEAEERLELAGSAEELRKRFAEKYHVDAIEPYDFQEWLDDAADATKSVIATGKAPANWRSAVWAALKQYLYSISNGYCGYCETRVLVATQGEVEHYRPKGRVEEDATHPGYYWLAYDVENYVPTCPACNGGKQKRNFFPIKGKRAKKPDDKLESEKPLLLNPLRDTPSKHLTFIADPESPAFCMIKGTSPQGKQSERVYGLNRGTLKDDRRREMNDFLYRLNTTRHQERLAVVREVEEGLRPYYATAMAVLAEWVAKEERELDSLRKAAPGP